MSRARELDQFYTRPVVAQRLVRELLDYLESKGKLGDPGLYFCEPSAGEGAFLDALKEQYPNNRTDAVDIDPKHQGVRQLDFLESTVHPGGIFFGNPPFGKNSSLAVRFFNHAAKGAKVIAFIVPRTFEKDSVQDRLDPRFELAKSVPVLPGSFTLDGRRALVSCVFQIWVRLPDGETRPKKKRKTTHEDFSFLPSVEGADFAFQRVGSNAGRLKSTGLNHLSPSSHYFIQASPGMNPGELWDRLNAVNWQPIKERTAGNPSISKAEMVEAYEGQPTRTF